MSFWRKGAARRRAGGGGGGTTFDPSHRNADIALANGNLTASLGSVTSGDRIVRATNNMIGKRAAEITIMTLGSGGAVGFVNASESMATGDYLGMSINSIGWYPGGAVGYNYNAAAGWVLLDTIAGYDDGDTLMLLSNTTLGKCWFKKGGTTYPAGSDPAAGTGGYTLPSGAIYLAANLKNSNDSMTGNFAGGFANSLPSGFSAQDAP